MSKTEQPVRLGTFLGQPIKAIRFQAYALAGDVDFTLVVGRNPHPEERKAVGLHLDDQNANAEVWAFFVDDCFDPPFAVVAASNMGEAEEAFLNNFDWADVTEPDLSDYDPEGDNLYWTERGTVASTEEVRAIRCKVLGVEF